MSVACLVALLLLAPGAVSRRITSGEIPPEAHAIHEEHIKQLENHKVVLVPTEGKAQAEAQAAERPQEQAAASMQEALDHKTVAMEKYEDIVAALQGEPTPEKLSEVLVAYWVLKEAAKSATEAAEQARNATGGGCNATGGAGKAAAEQAMVAASSAQAILKSAMDQVSLVVDRPGFPGWGR